MILPFMVYGVFALFMLIFLSILTWFLYYRHNEKTVATKGICSLFFIFFCIHILRSVLCYIIVPPSVLNIIEVMWARDGYVSTFALPVIIFALLTFASTWGTTLYFSITMKLSTRVIIGVASFIFYALLPALIHMFSNPENSPIRFMN